MKYLDKVLGIEVTYENVEFKHLPNFIATRYRLQMVAMNGQRAIFLYPKTELEQIEVLKKHIARIQKNENLPVVLVLNELSFRQKEYLIREKTPFIVEGKQIYLPFMAMYLQERCNAEREPREEILPSAQMLLLHFIYGGAQELSTSQAAKDLELTPTSISRASKQLEEMGLLHIKKLGVQRILQSGDSPKMLFQKAGDKLLNPIKRTVYISKERAAEKNCLSAVFTHSQQPLEMDGSSNSVLLYDGSGDGRVDSDLYSDSSSSGCDTGDGVERYHPNCRKGNRTGGSTGCAVYFESIYTIHCFIAGDSSNVLLLVYNGVGHFDVWRVGSICCGCYGIRFYHGSSCNHLL